MELRDLRIFQVIAEEESISKAANRLDYVQSNVTARLKKLEDELGVLLFYRNANGVMITEKGVIFRRYVDSILQLAEESVSAIQDEDRVAGTLRIGVVETVTCGNFMNLISTYQTKYDEVALRLETGTPTQLMEKIKNYQLDGAFVTGDLSATNFMLDYVQTDEIVLLSQKKGSIAKVYDQKWAIAPKGCPYRSRLERWFQDNGLVLTNYIEISSLETTLSSVKEGIASTILPKSVATGAYEHLHYEPIPDPYRFIETGLVRRKERYMNRAYQAFAELVRQQGV